MKTVNDIYEYIGQLIMDNSPSSWDLAVLKAKLTDDTVGTKGEFQCRGKKIFFDEILDDVGLDRALEDLYKLTSTDSESKWNRMEYILEPSGKFKVNFEWDQEWVDEMERLANE